MAKQSTATVTPRLRFPEFRKTMGWESQRLNDLTDVVRGGSPRPIDAYITTRPDGLNWLKIGDVPKDSKFITGTEQKVLRTALSKTREVLPGDFILSNSMSFGRPYLSKIKTCIHDGWIAVTSLPNSFNRDFLYYSMMTEASQTYFENQAAGGGVRNLTVDIVKLLTVCVPTEAEQQKIADCLTSLDEVIAAQGRKVEALKTHKRGLMQQLFPREGETVPRLRFPEFRGAGEWSETRLSSLGGLVSGLTYSPDDVRENGLLVLRSSNVQNAEISLEDNVYVVPDIKGANLAKPHDILICVRNGSKALIGKSALIPEGMPLCTHGAFMTVFRARAPQFVFQLMQSPSFQKQVSADLGATINSINGGQLLKYRFVVPEPKEQRRIANCLASLDAQITAESDQLAALKTHKQGLMQQLFPAPEAT